MLALLLALSSAPDLATIEARLPARSAPLHRAGMDDWQARREEAAHATVTWLDADAGLGHATGQDRLSGAYGTAGVRWSVALWGPKQRAAREAAALQGDSLALERQARYRHDALLQEVRHLYVSAWNARRCLAFSDAFLATAAAADSLLQLRTRAHLVLESDRQELLTAWLAARRDTAWQHAQIRQARIALGAVLGDSADLPDWDTPPRIPRPAPVAARTPDSGATSRQSTGRTGWERLDVQTGVDLRGDKWQDRSAGSDARVFVAVHLPLGSVADPKRRIEAAAHLHALEDAKQESLRSAELAQALEAWKASPAAVDFAIGRLEAAKAAAHEARLRAQASEKEPLEKLLQANAKLYRTWIETMDADARALHQAIDALSLGAPASDSTLTTRLDPIATAPEVLVGSTMASARTTCHQDSPPFHRMLVWDTRTLERHPSALAKQLKRSGFASVALSWPAARLQQLLGTPEGQAELRAVLAPLERNGLRCDFLLGDAGFLLPQAQDKLAATVRDLAALGFRHVVLDLEPGQLPPGQLPGPLWKASLVRAAKTVLASGRMPVELLLPPSIALDSTDIGNALEQEASAGLSAMLYTRSPESLFQRADRFLAFAGTMPRRVAVSMEAPPALASDETLRPLGREGLSELMQHLTSQLGPCFAGFDIQSLTDWEGAAP